MNNLVLNQKKVFTPDELQLVNAFYNVSKKNKTKKFNKEEEAFINKLALLKMNPNTIDLYYKSLSIYNKINLQMADKYLKNYLEYHNITFKELISQKN